MQELEGDCWLVSDRDNSRVIEIDRTGKIYWSYAKTTRQHAPTFIGNDGSGMGHYLVSDSEGNRVFEFTRDGTIVWEYAEGLKWPRCVEKLANGNYLITDSNGHRVIEVTPAKTIVKEFKGLLCCPYEAHRLDNGNTLVCDAQNARIIELDPLGKPVWEFGNLRFPESPREICDAGLETIATGVAVNRSAGIERRPLVSGAWQVGDMVGHGSGVWSVVSDVTRAGSRAVSIRSDKADGASRWWGQRVAVKPGDRLNLFVAMKTATGVAGAAGISVTWMDALGGQLGGATSRPVSGRVDWATVPLSAVAPQGAAMAEIALALVGEGKAWFDEVEFGRE